LIYNAIKEIKKTTDNLLTGLDPHIISYWFDQIIRDVNDMVPSWLVNKINIKQDENLPMKFNIHVSKRTIRYLIQAIDQNIVSMSYSTKLYFLKIEELIELETNKLYK